MKIIPSLFKNKETRNRHHHQPWQKWPSCNYPKTLSFRADDIFKTVNSVFFDPTTSVEHVAEIETPKSWFTNSSEATSFPTDQSEDFGGDSLEVVVRGARSERLFFEPGDTNSILEKAKPGGFPFQESVVLAMESDDPYVDFRRSMEDMVESHGLKDWGSLEELLVWYLKVNGKKNHGFIIGAFIDLLVGIGAAASYSDSTTFSSVVSSFSSSSSPFCSLENGYDEIQEEELVVLC
ncbi:transcription repressor OFP13 [Ricinus communis]|uniref:Transcription repressor n=1 Tax=Ricinus communis TaxID=3988 RepID=B9RSA9_RICCO|nr:transcription repressor OFP13 [Ricinus communis]EEF45752.1 conserved hypothetical protein [Ricinus communis]|eukprot:XP_002516628.1 transcription repressor OFP13 [Ricinus communis]